MAFLTGTINLNVYTDANQTQFPQLNLPNFAASWTNNAVTGVQPLYLNIAANGTQVINLNGLTSVTQFYIYSDNANLNLTLNGTSGFSVKFGVPGYVPIAVTSMTIANASGASATNVTLILIQG